MIHRVADALDGGEEGLLILANRLRERIRHDLSERRANQPMVKADPPSKMR